MQLKAVLFDMDGVIVDTEPLHRKAYFKMFETFGMQVSDEMYATFAGASTKRVCDTLISHFGLQESRETLMETKRAFFKEIFDHDPEFDLLPGVRALIEHYRQNQITMVLASSASMQTITWVFEKFGLDPYFKAKISGADLRESKPHPEIFLKAAELSGFPKEHCMVIEDSTNGVLAAHRAEIFCAGYISPHTEGQHLELANICVSDYCDLEVEKVGDFFPYIAE